MDGAAADAYGIVAAGFKAALAAPAGKGGTIIAAGCIKPVIIGIDLNLAAFYDNIGCFQALIALFNGYDTAFDGNISISMDTIIVAVQG